MGIIKELVEIWPNEVCDNGPDINLLMIKSKQAYVSLYSLAKTHIYLAERKNVITSFINGKHPLQKTSKNYFLNFEDEKQQVIKPTYAMLN